MPRSGYHTLAAVHHVAKADAYAQAGLGEKARCNRGRAAWHASFGAGYVEDDVVGGFPMRVHRDRPSAVHDPVRSPLEYDGHLREDEEQWNPDTADPRSEAYDPRSEYSRMLAEVRASGAFAPSGAAGGRDSPIEDGQRRGYAARAERAQDAFAARNELTELTHDIYAKRVRGDDAKKEYRRLTNSDRGHVIGDDTGERYDAVELARAIEREAARNRRFPRG
jgi:hypothetical protein